MLAVRTPESPPNYVTNKQKSLSLQAPPSRLGGPRTSPEDGRVSDSLGTRVRNISMARRRGELRRCLPTAHCKNVAFMQVATCARPRVPPGRLRSGVSLPLARRCLASLPLPAVAAPGVSAEGSGPSRHHSSPVQTCRSRSAPNGPTVGFPTVSVAALPFPPGSGGGVGALVGCWPW